MKEPDLSDPNAVRSTSFTSSRKGYDKSEVGAFLNRVAGHMESQQRALSALEARLAGVESELDRAQIEAVRELDKDELTELLGAEAAKVLQAAHAAEAERLGKADADAAAMLERAEQEVLNKLAAADEDASRLLERARSESERLRQELQQVEETGRQQLEDDRSQAVELSSQARQRAAADATDEIEAAKDQGRELVLEAQVVRKRMLKDLSRRRQSGRRELEQIRAGRDRLLAAFEAAARTLDEILDELTIALPEARLAAEAAGRRFGDDELSVEELEHELAAARDVGLPIVDTATSELSPSEVAPAPAVDATTKVEAPRDSVAPHRPTGPTVVLSELGPGKRGIFGKRSKEHDGLPTEEVPILRLPDTVEGVRVVSGVAETGPAVADAIPEQAVKVAEQDLALVDDGEVRPEEVHDEVIVPVAEDEVADASLDDEVGALFAKMRATTEDGAAPSDGLDQSAKDADRSAKDPAADETPAEPDVDTTPVAARSSIDDAERMEQRDDALAVHVTAVTTALKRALADDQNELFDVFRRTKNKVDEGDLPPTADQALAYLRSAGPALGATFIAGAQFADGPAGEVDLSLPAEIIADTLVASVRESMLAVVQADDVHDPIAAIRSAAREIRNNQVRQVAEAAAHAAFSRGMFGALGDQAAHRWVTDPQHECGSDCADNARVDSVPRGEPFPSGVLHPPAIAGCRCLAVEV